MSRSTLPAFGITSLRREAKPFAWLGAILLALQLLVSGSDAGAMAGEPTEILCIGSGEVRTVVPDEGDRHGPCEGLASGACGGSVAGAAPDGGSIVSRRPPADGKVFALSGFAVPALKPLDLFARAGRGPPLLS